MKRKEFIINGRKRPQISSSQISPSKKLHAQEINLNRILGAVNALSDLKDRKRGDEITQDVKNLFKLKKDINNVSRLKNKAIKDRIIRDIRNLFEQEKEDSHKAAIAGNFWSRNYTEYKSTGDKNKMLLTEEHLHKIIPYLKDIINDLEKPDTWKIQLTIAISFISSKYNDEEQVMHSKRDNIEIKVKINGKADEVINKRFQSLLSRKQNWVRNIDEW